MRVVQFILPLVLAAFLSSSVLAAGKSGFRVFSYNLHEDMLAYIFPMSASGLFVARDRQG